MRSDKEDDEEEEMEEEEEAEGVKTSLIKSSDPHLADGAAKKSAKRGEMVFF